MTFPLPTKEQIFNAEIRDYKKIFKYPEPSIFYIQEHPDQKFISGIWCVREYGEEWYNDSEFWKKFIENVTPPFVTMAVYIDEQGEDFISEFLLNFRNQILWADQVTNKALQNNEDDKSFVKRFLSYAE